MTAKPPFPYVGGKRRLLKVIDQNIPEEFGNYYEPFLGAGAVAIHMMQKYPGRHFYLSDYSWDVTLAWISIQQYPDELIELLHEHAMRHNRDYFAKIAHSDRTTAIHQMSTTERGARLIYICCTSFGGGFSYDKSGHCSSSFGKSEWIPNVENIHELSKLLNDNPVHIYQRDFVKVAEYMKAGDFIYLDPPYATDFENDPNYKGNDAYAKNADTPEIIKQTHELMDLANDAGAYALANNASTPTTEALWEGWNSTSSAINWTSGKNISRPPQTERLWGNNALHRVLTLNS